MKKEVKFYRCRHCGNIITFLKESGVPVVCCGDPMTKLEANTTDAAVEKHVPAINKADGKVQVAIGSVLHPMLAEHYIEWIACVSEERVEFAFLEPGDVPTAEFCDLTTGTVYEYCNLHGLWKADF